MTASFFPLFIYVLFIDYTDVSLIWGYCHRVGKLLFGSEYPSSKSLIYIMETQRNSRSVLSITLKFIYHERVIFSALKYEMVFRMEDGKEGRMGPVCQGKNPLMPTTNLKGKCLNEVGTLALAASKLRSF